MVHRFPEDFWKEKAMGPKRKPRKRPCRICRKWFNPSPRLGERQKTCGADECQRRWHARRCTAWNRQNRPYFKEIYLMKRLESCGTARPSSSSVTTSSREASSSSLSGLPLGLPRRVFQEVMGRQQAVIIGYILRLLIREVQEVISAQHTDIHRALSQLPPSSVSRGDSQQPP